MLVGVLVHTVPCSEFEPFPAFHDPVTGNMHDRILASVRQFFENELDSESSVADVSGFRIQDSESSTSAISDVEVPLLSGGPSLVQNSKDRNHDGVSKSGLEEATIPTTKVSKSIQSSILKFNEESATDRQLTGHNQLKERNLDSKMIQVPGTPSEDSPKNSLVFQPSQLHEDSNSNHQQPSSSPLVSPKPIQRVNSFQPKDIRHETKLFEKTGIENFDSFAVPSPEQPSKAHPNDRLQDILSLQGMQVGTLNSSVPFQHHPRDCLEEAHYSVFQNYQNGHRNSKTSSFISPSYSNILRVQAKPKTQERRHEEVKEMLKNCRGYEYYGSGGVSRILTYIDIDIQFYNFFQDNSKFNNLWLNEGFASYLENLGVDAVSLMEVAENILVVMLLQIKKINYINDINIWNNDVLISIGFISFKITSYFFVTHDYT